MQNERGNNPFPGLRPFEANETHLFFGREGQADELLRKLVRARLVAVVGTSGSGKSSLVRAGLLPALYGGITSIGSKWRVAVMRPGNDPIGNLAAELASCAGEGGPRPKLGLVGAILRRSERGLVEATRQLLHTEGGSPDNLLIVVDQFEELFRFGQQRGARDEASSFVNLLLEARTQNESGIFTVLTMRLDYLRDCAQFWGLPEAINEGQYLIPRMKREERRAAITGPVGVGGGEISSRLVNRLLNEAGDNPGQLPILQHALMQTWEAWSGTGRRVMDAQDYEAVGGMGHALSEHADQVYDELSLRGRIIAEKLFRSLVGLDTEGRVGRRPLKLEDLCQALGASFEEVREVVEKFRLDGRSFLTPPPKFPLLPESVIDISHESLIGGWARLNEWVKDENEDANIYHRLAETAEMASRGRANLYRGRELSYTLRWQKTFAPTKAWAKRYHPGFDEAVEFLRASRAQRNLLRVSFPMAIVILLGLLVLYLQRQETQRQVQESESVAVQATSLLNYRPEMSLQLAYRALSTSPADEALDALRQSLAARPALAAISVSRGRVHYGVRAAAFSPADAGLVMTADERGRVELRRWPTTGPGRAPDFGQRDEQVRGFDRPGVTAAAFSSDGKQIITADERGGLEVRVVTEDMGKSDPLTLSGAHSDAINSVAFDHARGTYAVTASSDGTARVWRIGPGGVTPASEPLRHPESVFGQKRVTSWVKYAAFSPSDKYVVTACWDHHVRVWEWGAAGAGAQPLQDLDAHGDGVNSISFDSSGKYILTASSDTSVIVWEWDERQGRIGKRVGLLKHNWPVLRAAFGRSTDGYDNIVTAGGDGNAAVWRWSPSLQDWEIIHPLNGHADWVVDASFNPMGDYVVTAGDDGNAFVWETVRSPQRLRVDFEGHTGPVLCAAFSEKGALVATGGGGGDGNFAQVWDFNANHLARFSEQEPVRSVGFSGDGRSIMTAAGTGGHVWPIPASRADYRTADSFVSPAGINSAALSPDGRLVAAACQDGRVRLWALGNSESVAVAEGHTGAVNSVAFNADGSMILTAGDDGTTRVWLSSVAGGKPSLAKGFVLKGHNGAVRSAAFSADGAAIATAGSDGTVRVWDALGGGQRFQISNDEGSSTPIVIRSVSFSPDGAYLLTADVNNVWRIWKTSDHQRPVVRQVEAAPVVNSDKQAVGAPDSKRPSLTYAGFDPTGQYIIVTRTDGTARMYLWNYYRPAQVLLDMASQFVNR